MLFGVRAAARACFVTARTRAAPAVVFPSRSTDPARLSSIAAAAAELTPLEETATIISWPTWSRRLNAEASSVQRGWIGVAGDDAAAVADPVAGPVALRLAAPLAVCAEVGALGWPGVVGPGVVGPRLGALVAVGVPASLGPGLDPAPGCVPQAVAVRQPASASATSLPVRLERLVTRGPDDPAAGRAARSR
jgi:hypothetical protein